MTLDYPGDPKPRGKDPCKREKRQGLERWGRQKQEGVPPCRELELDTLSAGTDVDFGLLASRTVSKETSTVLRHLVSANFYSSPRKQTQMASERWGQGSGPTSSNARQEQDWARRAEPLLRTGATRDV